MSLWPDETFGDDYKYWQLATMAHDWRWVGYSYDDLNLAKHRAGVIANRRRNSKRNFSAKDSVQENLIGNLGEIALARYLGLPVQGLNSKPDLPDVGPYDIKTQSRQLDWILEVNDYNLKSNMPYISAFVLEAKRAVAFIGWAPGYLVRNGEHYVSRKDGHKVYFLRWLHLRPLSELKI